MRISAAGLGARTAAASASTASTASRASSSSELEGHVEAAALARQRLGQAPAAGRPGRSGAAHLPGGCTVTVSPCTSPQPLARSRGSSRRRGTAVRRRSPRPPPPAAGNGWPRSSKKSRASSFGSSTRRPDGSAMPPASSRATRQARYSASTARAGIRAARRRASAISASGTASAAEQRVGEAPPAAPTSSCRSCAAGQCGEIDAERLAQLDQQRGRDGALVVLDQVQIAGGDAEPRGQRLLRQARRSVRSRRTVRPISARAMTLHPLQIPGLPR